SRVKVNREKEKTHGRSFAAQPCFSACNAAGSELAPRYYAICCQPLVYRNKMTPLRVALMIGGCWSIPTFISFLPIMQGWNSIGIDHLRHGLIFLSEPYFPTETWTDLPLRAVLSPQRHGLIFLSEPYFPHRDMD
ncbi:hypothetical protein KUCAC02_037772, partial [Chaenocephalus aceratus]